jgi:hypothetical protein
MPFTFCDIELREFGGGSATNNIAACALRGVETPSRRTMPLQNRVNPFGELCNFPARGLFMGNRGGRFHADAKTLTARRWASRQWICCVLNFKGRRREIWGRSYTELFFLDEPTALAAGHRPCFECRRKDAQAFAEKWREVHRYRKPPYAAEIDNVLHAERLQGHVKRLHRRATSTSCPTAQLPHSMVRPSPFGATRSCTGRRKATALASSGRAVSLSTCSLRPR